MKVRPLADRVLVEILEAEETKAVLSFRIPPKERLKEKYRMVLKNARVRKGSAYRGQEGDRVLSGNTPATTS